jgi:hypothetical protein
VRTSTRLHADDAIGGERLAPYQEFHVLAGEDIVGDYAELVVGTHALAERVDERGLAGANRTADADSNRSGHLLRPWMMTVETRFCGTP